MKTLKILTVVLCILSITSCSKKSKTPGLHHTAIWVSDMNSSADFYSEVFGLSVVKDIDTLIISGDDEDIIATVNIKFLSFSENGHILELIGNNRKDSLFYSPYQHLAISVLDIEKTYSDAVKHGAISVREPQLVYSEGMELKNAFLKGPDGENIELMQWLK